MRSRLGHKHKGKVGRCFWSRLEGARATMEIRVVVNFSLEFWRAEEKVNERLLRNKTKLAETDFCVLKIAVSTKK